MKVFTFKRLLGLTMIGGVAYIHKQRGGEWTVDSVRNTLKHLWSSAVSQLGPLKDEIMKAPRFDRSAESANKEGARGRTMRDRATNLTDDYQARSPGGATAHKDDAGRH